MNQIDQAPGVVGVGAVYVSGIWLARQFTPCSKRPPLAGAPRARRRRDLFTAHPAEEYVPDRRWPALSIRAGDRKSPFRAPTPSAPSAQIAVA